MGNGIDNTRAQRQAAWRERRRLAGETIHPERAKRAEQGRPARPERSAERKPWLMIDTEGADDPDGVYGDPGRQWTMTMTAASDDGFERHVYTGKPLNTAQMLSFITQLPRDYRIGGFFLGYDYSQMLRDVPADDLKRLLGQGQEAKPIIFGRWVLSMFNTQLRLVAPNTTDQRGVTHLPHEVPDDIRKVKGVTRTVWDVGRFYNAKLTTALETWKIATPAEQEFLERMKALRSDFTLDRYAEQAGEIIRYSLLENRLTARLQTQFDQVMSEQGYPLTSWYGAGSAAKAMLRAHGIDKHLEQRRPFKRPKRGPAMIEHLPDAYFGGRFEIQAPGRYAPVYEYDICSAYPAAYRELPCLIHGDWTHSRDLHTIMPDDLFLVDWKLPSSHVWGPFPHRQRNGTICYPSAGTEHAVWGTELAAALQLWPTEIRITRRWRYQTKCECRMFDFIDDVYRRRLELGKDAKGYTLRISMNAIYGTLASALGVTLEDGQLKGWCEPRWASMLTAWTRAKLLDALWLAGGPESREVIMFATDAIYTTTPIPDDSVVVKRDGTAMNGLKFAKELGAWEAHEFPQGGLLIQPGLYHLTDQSLVSKLKGRGIAFADMQERIQAFYDAWDADGADGEVHLELSPRYVGIRLALARGKLETAWRWSETKRTLRLDPSAKRERRTEKFGAINMALKDLGVPEHWYPRSADGLTGPAPHPIFALLLLAVQVGIPTVPEDQRLESISAAEQPEGPMGL